MRGAGTLEGRGGRGSQQQERGGGGRGWRWPCEREAEEEAGSGMDAGVWGRLGPSGLRKCLGLCHSTGRGPGEGGAVTVQPRARVGGSGSERC